MQQTYTYESKTQQWPESISTPSGRQPDLENLVRVNIQDDRSVLNQTQAEVGVLP